MNMTITKKKKITHAVYRHFHFPKVNNICHHSSNYLTNLSRSFCKCCLSPYFSLSKYVLSSANFSTLLFILYSKSLIYIKNNKGPNTDPCGTQFKTDFQFETSRSTTTRCLLSVSQFYPVDYAIPDTMRILFKL